MLANKVLEYLAPRAGGRYIDGTVGAGGHTAAILRRAPGAQILGIDRDQSALACAAANLASFGRNVQLRHGSFADLDQTVAQTGWSRIDGILLDIGVSSMQIDNPERGFSYRVDGPLDMRMDRSQERTAAMILNKATERELAELFRQYGEAPGSRRIARAVIDARSRKSFGSTMEFADLIAAVAPRQKGRHTPPAARFFQALRIAVNDELASLERGVDAAMDLLAAGGRMVVISFHSLEDRIVKHRFRHAALNCVCPPALPVCRCGKVATLAVLTKRPVRPDEVEVANNPRAHSARLRVGEKIG